MAEKLLQVSHVDSGRSGFLELMSQSSVYEQGHNLGKLIKHVAHIFQTIVLRLVPSHFSKDVAGVTTLNICTKVLDRSVLGSSQRSSHHRKHLLMSHLSMDPP